MDNEQSRASRLDFRPKGSQRIKSQLQSKAGVTSSKILPMRHVLGLRQGARTDTAIGVKLDAVYGIDGPLWRPRRDRAVRRRTPAR